jgi:diacylglycerol kinase family enzyme
LGSGNGLARHLKLPKKLSNALDIAFGDEIVRTDTGLLNGKPFFSVAGVGFDAFIAHRFSEMKNRGFRNYVKAVLKNYVRYKPQHYKINLGEQKFETHALMITFANSNQFGNNTSIAPKANISDGLIDLCIMRKPAAVAAVFLAPMLFLKKMDRTRFLKIYRTNRIEVETSLPAFIHFDGDPYILEKSKIVFEMIPASLNIHV